MTYPRPLLAISLFGLVAGCSANSATTNGVEIEGGNGSVSAAGNPASNSGGSSASAGATQTQAGNSAGGTQPSSGGGSSSGGASTAGGASGSGGAGTSHAGASGAGPANGGAANGGSASGGATGAAGSTSSAGATGAAGSAGSSCTGPIGTIAGALATGVAFTDTEGKAVNAHGGGIIQVGNTFYMHGEYFLPGSTTDDFNGFSMYSSTDMATWKNEGIILPQQPACTGTQSPTCGALGPVTKGERPHIIKCPSTGEYVLYAHAASEDYQTWKAVVYATSTTVNGKYSFKGPLTNASGTIAAHSDMSAYADNTGAYVVTESGEVYTLATDCHSWVSDKAAAVNGDSGGSEAPTVFKAGSTYYWIGSYKTGWRANNNFYSTAPAMTGPWTYQGFVAPVTDTTNDISDQRTWLSQTTWVQPVTGCNGTTYVFWGDHWYGDQDTTAPGKHNDQATYVFQPLVFTGTKISMPTYLASWMLNVGAGTWSQ